MVLKINNNLITPSHIIEGEKVNDTYFDGKYHLMLPNSEEHFLTSVSERKQLLNESLRSNLYDRKTRGTIVNNTTAGKMFDEEIIGSFKNKYTSTNQYQYLQLTEELVNQTKLSSYEVHLNFCWDRDHNYGTSVWKRIYVPREGCSFRLVNTGGYCKFCFNLDNNEEFFTDLFPMEKNKHMYVKLVASANGSYVECNAYWKEKNDVDWNVVNVVSKESSARMVWGQRVQLLGTDQYASDWFPGYTYADDLYGKYTTVDGTTKEFLTGTEFNNNGCLYEYIDNRKRIITQHPFNQSVTINSSEIQEGTKYLVDYPGMFQIKTEDNTLAVKFLFEENPVWKYIKQEELVEGDNVFSLVSDTEKLKFIVNTTEHILVDSTLTEEVRCFINNSTENNYWQLINPFNPGENDWEISFDFYSGTGGRGAQGIFINEVSDQYGTRIGMSSGYFSFLNGNGSWINTSSYYGGDRIEDNKLYHVQAGYKNNNYYIKHSFDGNEYKTDVSYNSSRKISSVKSKIGIIYNASGVKFYIDTLKIIVGNEVIFNGKTAVEGVDYTVVGSPTIETETIHVGGEIPELTAGYLGYREGWKLKQGE